MNDKYDWHQNAEEAVEGLVVCICRGGVGMSEMKAEKFMEKSPSHVTLELIASQVMDELCQSPWMYWKCQLNGL